MRIYSDYNLLIQSVISIVIMAEKPVDNIPQWTIADSGNFKWTVLKISRKPKKEEEKKETKTERNLATATTATAAASHAKTERKPDLPAAAASHAKTERKPDLPDAPDSHANTERKPDLAAAAAASHTSVSKDTATDIATTIKEPKTRSCAYNSCDKTEMNSLKLRCCRKCIDERILIRRFYCSKDCQTADWSLQHRAFHKESRTLVN